MEVEGEAEEMSVVDLNMNDTVMVSLTKLGRDVLNEYYINWRSVGLVECHHKAGPVYEFQIYELMCIFGKYMEAPNTQYFELNRITIEK